MHPSSQTPSCCRREASARDPPSGDIFIPSDPSLRSRRERSSSHLSIFISRDRSDKIGRHSCRHERRKRGSEDGCVTSFNLTLSLSPSSCVSRSPLFLPLFLSRKRDPLLCPSRVHSCPFCQCDQRKRSVLQCRDTRRVCHNSTKGSRNSRRRREQQQQQQRHSWGEQL